MRSQQIRYWLLFSFLLSASALSLAHLFSMGRQEEWIDLSRLIPRSVGDWTGEDEALDEGTRRLLGAKNVLLRAYTRADAGASAPPVLLCITFSAGSHRIAHPAEVCYEGQGWDISINEDRVLEFEGAGPSGKTVNHLRIKRKGETYDVIVWYRTSSQETSSFIRQKTEMLMSNLFGGSRWSAMIRLSARVDPENESLALEWVQDFGSALYPCLDALNREMEAR
jgi:EpsI family protein